MNKLWLIVKREYLVRVRKRTFILATLLTPLGIGLIAFVSGYLASNSMGNQKKIIYVDQTEVLDSKDLTNDQYLFEESNLTVDALKNKYIEDGYDLLIEVPPLKDLKSRKHTVNFFSKEKLSFVALEQIERKLSRELKKYKVSQSAIDQSTLDELEVNVTLENATSTEEVGSNSNTSSRMSSAISSVLSYVMGFLMYMVIFIYGSLVMRSVMEEKTNRIVEVVISSVKPFQLMLGKLIGVGLVAFTQLAIWMILIPILITGISAFMGVGDTVNTPETAEMIKTIQESSDDVSFASILAEVKAMNWLLIIPSFICFFLGGYFIYSSLFAAIGSAIGDDLGEGQQLMMPIVIIVIIGLVMVPAVLTDHDGPVAIFGSMFPLFSPIVMPARLPFDPPVWQVLVSIFILIASVIFMTWMAGRIYRVGILMYGKKVSFKELGKWLFYKG